MFDGVAGHLHSLTALKIWRGFSLIDRGKWDGTVVSDSYFLDVMLTQLRVKQLCRRWVSQSESCSYKFNFESDPTTTANVFKCLDLLAINSCHCELLVGYTWDNFRWDNFRCVIRWVKKCVFYKLGKKVSWKNFRRWIT